MSVVKDQLQRLLATSDQVGQAPEVAVQLKTLLEQLRMEQLCEQVDIQRPAEMSEQKDDQLAALLTQLLSALNGAPAQQPDYHHQRVQERQAAAVAAANNQQQVQALLQQQLRLLQSPESRPQQRQALPPSMLCLQQQMCQQPQPQQHSNDQQYQSYDDQSYQQYASQLPVQQQQQQQSSQQQVTAGAAFLFGSIPSPTSAPPVQQQQQEQQQLHQEQQQEEAPPEKLPKRRRGRPASSSTKMHPNLVYVRRFRERQKQMELGLEATVKEKVQQLQKLKEEQQQLCVKWEALEQVLQVQSNVLCLMQQLSISDPAAASAAAEFDAHNLQSSKLQQQPQQRTRLAVEQEQLASDGHEYGSALNGATDHTRSLNASKPAAAQEHSVWHAVSTSLDPAIEAAVAEAAAVFRKSAPASNPAQEQAYLLQQARQWLEPVKMYIFRAALMLEQLGMLPDNSAAAAALAAAKASPAAAGLPPNSPAMASAVSAAIAAAAKELQPAAAANTAAAVAVAVRAAWDGAAAAADSAAGSSPQKQQAETLIDGVPLVQYPYSIGMYVITPDTIKHVCWPLNMETWRVDDGNNQAHAERAARAMWAVLRPERWRLLRATWLTMSNQLQQVQRDFVHLHHLLHTIGNRPQPMRGSSRSTSTAHTSLAEPPAQQQQQQQNGTMHVADGTNSDAGSSWASAEALPQQQQQHGLCYDGFASMEDSTAYEYAAAAVQVENVLLREDAISFQLCGAFLELLDPLEIAVGYVSSWPYHPQAFTIFDVIFKLGEPPEDTPSMPAVT